MTDIEEYKKRCSERTKGECNPRYGDHRTYEEIHGKEKADKLKKLISCYDRGSIHKKKPASPLGGTPAFNPCHGMGETNKCSVFSNSLLRASLRK